MDEEIDFNGMAQDIRKIPAKYIIAILVICLFFLFYFLGYTVGYRESFRGLTEQHNDYIAKYCFCREEPVYMFKPVTIKKEIKRNFSVV